MATPHVAAAAALVISTGVTDPDRVEKILEATAKNLKDPIRFGAGGLDAAAAVTKGTTDHAGGGLAVAFGLAGLALLRVRRKEGGAIAALLTPGLVVGAVLGSGALLAFAPAGVGAWAGWMALGAGVLAFSGLVTGSVQLLRETRLAVRQLEQRSANLHAKFEEWQRRTAA
jgi:MYXO-CTERM domain-containing protein